MSTEIVSFRLEPDVLAQLRDLANAQGCTVSDLMRRGVLMAIEEPNRMVITWTSQPAVTVLNSPQTIAVGTAVRPAVAAPDVTERPAEGTAQGEAYGGAEGRASVCPKCGTASCLDDASLDFDWNVVTDDPAPVVRTLNTIDPSELARLHKAEAERDGLRGKVEAVRALHANRDGECAVCVGPEREEILWDGDRETRQWVSQPAAWPCKTIQALDGEA